MVELLFAVSKMKSVELQFVVGEALSVIGAGYGSTASTDEYSAILRLNAPESGKSSSILVFILMILFRFRV